MNYLIYNKRGPRNAPYPILTIVGFVLPVLPLFCFVEILRVWFREIFRFVDRLKSICRCCQGYHVGNSQLRTWVPLCEGTRHKMSMSHMYVTLKVLHLVVLHALHRGCLGKLGYLWCLFLALLVRSRNIAGFGQAEDVEVLSLEVLCRRWRCLPFHHGNFGMWMFPKIGGFYPPKWMVYFMEDLIKMDDLGVPLFLETPM